MAAVLHLGNLQFGGAAGLRDGGAGGTEGARSQAEEEASARQAPVPLPILPDFLVLARACLWSLGARMWRVKLPWGVKSIPNPRLKPRIVFPFSFPVLARACLWCLGARMWRVKLPWGVKSIPNLRLTPRILFTSWHRHTALLRLQGNTSLPF